MAKHDTEIKASWFEKTDQNHVGYSVEEYDIYQFPTAKGKEEHNLKDHRLTLWKNHKTGCFELVEHRFDGSGDFVISVSSDLQTVLDRATERVRQAWPNSKERFVAAP
jgi:hypothetical protein